MATAATHMLSFPSITLPRLDNPIGLYGVPAQQLQELYESNELLNEGLTSFEYPLYRATDEELDYFLGNVVHSIAKAASGVTHGISDAAKAAGKVAAAVNKVIPSSLIGNALSFTPLGMAAKAGWGALSAIGSGKNAFAGAINALAADPASRFLVSTATSAAQGRNVFKAAQEALKDSVKDVRESVRFAAMVAPFVPGIGTGAAAALAAANALASGQPITEALLAAAKNALPGGAIAATAFDMATNLAKGKSLSTSLLEAARSRLPGGPAAQAAFDAGLALAKGKSLQDAAFAGAGRLLPKSPFSEDALAFARKVASGENIQKAALSQAGNFLMKKIEQKTGPILSNVPGHNVLVNTARHAPPVRHETAFEIASLPPLRHHLGGQWRRNGDLIILLHVFPSEPELEDEWKLGDVWHSTVAGARKYGLPAYAAAQMVLSSALPHTGIPDGKSAITEQAPHHPENQGKIVRESLKMFQKAQEEEERRKKREKEEQERQRRLLGSGA